LFPLILISIMVISGCTSSNSSDSLSGLEELSEKYSTSGLVYSVNHTTTADVLGSQYMYEEPDGVFVLIGINIENTGKKSKYITNSDVKLIDHEDREFDVDTGAAAYLSTMGYKTIIFDELGPGLSKTGYLVFDVPPNDKGLVLHIGEESIEIGDVSDIKQ